jgi:hypothetical protein
MSLSCSRSNRFFPICAVLARRDALPALWLTLRASVVGTALALTAVDVSALSYVMMRDSELFDDAKGAVRATVIERLPTADGDFETHYLIRVDEVLAGPNLGQKQRLALPGTFAAPSRNVRIDGVPALGEGTELLLFYRPRERDGVLQPQQLTLGLFARTPSENGDVYVRYLARIDDHAKSDDRLRYHAPRAATGFEQWIRDRGQKRLREPDYLLEGVDVAVSKYAFSDFSSAGLGPYPGRWFQFDSDQPLRWRANAGGQTGVGAASFTMLSAALGGWVNDPNSRIALQYDGQFTFGSINDFEATCSVFVDGTFTAGCFAGHVFWNDPDNWIPGSYNGSGTIAFGGSYTGASLERTFGGNPWYQRILGFVVVQDGAMDAIMNGNSGADGTEMLVHEVGHAIGFGHSCELGSNCTPGSAEDQATMRSAIHRDGRGPTLGIDDVAGAAVIYPMPGGSGGMPCGSNCVFRSSFEAGEG